MCHRPDTNTTINYTFSMHKSEYRERIKAAQGLIHVLIDSVPMFHQIVADRARHPRLNYTLHQLTTARSSRSALGPRCSPNFPETQIPQIPQTCYAYNVYKVDDGG